MRPFSHKTTRSNKHKYAFQTKLKSRVRGYTEMDSNASYDLPNTSHQPLNLTNSHHHQRCALEEGEFNRSAHKLSETNFNHHNPDLCLCDQCHCGRHLCKLHIIKPDLTKATVYQKSFQQQAADPVQVTFAHEYDRLKGPHLDMHSTYHQGFGGRKGDELQRPKPEDLLHAEGPVQNITSYSTQYPGHKGNNQYVKPTDRHFRGYFPMRSKSTYSDAYVIKKMRKDDYKYIKDQLKTGSNWLGASSYGGFFPQPNPEYFAKPVKIVEKKENNPDFSLQYQTTYKNNFVSKTNQQCPAKVHLQTRAKGSYSESKGNFTQNSDFKALSPNFHAISTSKNYYV